LQHNHITKPPVRT